jgi:hypothetical protein
MDSLPHFLYSQQFFFSTLCLSRTIPLWMA